MALRRQEGRRGEKRDALNEHNLVVRAVMKLVAYEPEDVAFVVDWQAKYQDHPASRRNALAANRWLIGLAAAIASNDSIVSGFITRPCPIDGKPVLDREGSGRQRVYCSDACRQKAHRQRGQHADTC